MNNEIFKCYLDNDDTPIVICDLDYRIIYVNPCAARRYKDYGGNDIVGRSLSVFMNEEAASKVDAVVEWFKESPSNNNIFARYYEKDNEDVYMSAIRDQNGQLLGFCSRHKLRTREKGPAYNIC